VRIGVIAFSNLINDGRVARHVQALSALGEVVTIGYGVSPSGSFEHYEIPAGLPYLPLNIRGVSALLFRNFHAAYGYTPAISFVRQVLRSIRLDVVILNDVQTLGLMDSLAKETRTLVDMHEYAPEEMTDDWRFRLLLQRYYTALCSQYLPRADQVLTVSNSIATKFQSVFGVDCKVVMNAAPYLQAEPSSRTHPKIRLVHAGLASRGRRLETMIEAVDGLDGFELDLFLVPAPRQSRYFKKLTSYCSRVKNVTMREPLPREQLTVALNDFDIGLLVINPSNFSLANCLPNKLFEYIQARLMVLCGPTPDVMKIVNDEKIGLVTRDFSAVELRNSLSSISQSMIIEAKAGACSAAEVLNAERESEVLKELVLRLSGR
jgi:hypothetical protein